jgi:hypothetical protein
MVWPGAARLGDSVAMAIDSNYIPVPLQGLDRHDLSVDNVTVQVRQGSTTLATLSPRVVFDGMAAQGSIRAAFDPGIGISIVVLDLPASIAGLAPPAAVTLRVVVNGAPQSALVGSLYVTGTGGSPTVFKDTVAGDDWLDPEDLEPRAALRLHPQQVGGSGFDASWEVAGVQFDLEYPVAKLANPEAVAATEAARGAAFVGPEPSPGVVPVFLTAPNGFVFDGSVGTRVGQGPIIDILFDKVPGQGFAASDFVVRNLKVVDREGNLLSPVSPPGSNDTAFFWLIVRKNLAE